MIYRYTGPGAGMAHAKRPFVPGGPPPRDITDADLATERAKREGWETACKASPLYEEEKPKQPVTAKQPKEASDD